MFQVANQLTEHPCLVRVGNAAVLLLHHRDGQHFGPRQVVERNLLEFALVDGDGMLARYRRNLVGDGDQGVEALLTPPPVLPERRKAE